MLRQTKLLAEATARQIVQRAMGIISHSVNVMDSNGVIIASGNPASVGPVPVCAGLLVNWNG